MRQDASMGFELRDLDLTNDHDVMSIRQALHQHGVIVLRASPRYDLSRVDQLAFTQKLGRVIRLPRAFGGEVQVDDDGCKYLGWTKRRVCLVVYNCAHALVGWKVRNAV